MSGGTPGRWNVPGPALVVLALVAAFLVLATLRLWLGVVFLAACCAALAAYAHTDGHER